MEVLPYVMPPPPCCQSSLSASSSLSSCPMSARSLSSSVSSDPQHLTLSSSAYFSPHTPGPSCPDYCHSYSWQQSAPASLSTSPSSSSSTQSGRSTQSSHSTHSSLSSHSTSVPASIESMFPTYHSIYPTSTLPELYDAHTMSTTFKQDGFTEVYQWQDGPSTAYDPHTHPTHNAHYVFRGDIHIFYPQLRQSVYYRQGDRFEIPAELVHSTYIGPQGGVYMVASKRPEVRR